MERLRSNVDLLFIAALAAGGLAAQVLFLPPAVRAVAGVALAVLCPGYALVAALFPHPAFGRAERLALAVGLSLALTVLGGLALNASAFGITPRLWALLLAGVCFGALLLAALRRFAVRSAAPPSTVRRLPAQPAGPALSAAQGAVLGAAAALGVAALLLLRLPRPATDVQGYTALWLLPASSTAGTVSLGLDSSELLPTRYHLQVTVDGQVIQDWPDLTLAPGQQWQRVVRLPSTPGPGMVEAVLFRADQPAAVYRRAFWRPAS